MQTSTIVSPKVSRAVGTAFTAIGAYTPPTAAIIMGVSVCNISGAACTVTVTVYDGANDTNIAFATPLAAGDTLVLGSNEFRGALVNGWNIRVKSSVAASVDAAMFVTEFT